MRGGKPHWSTAEHLLDDVRMALVGTKKKPAKPHPLRPKATRTVRRPAITAGQRRRRERQRQIAAGEIT